MSSSKSIINIYTDGSCIGNPGPGGWAFIALVDGKEIKVSGGEEKTTNNRMELMAVIKAVESNNEFDTFIIYTDSNLTINCGMGLWKRKKNKDLWVLYDSVTRGKRIIFKKVKAHNGDHYNEMVDSLAKKFAEKYV